jgi:predicted nucleic acid-binding Zn ribbon protein
MMTTYLYETVPTREGETVKQYEIQQGMNDEPFTRHPQTGEAIRRVILGGWGLKKGVAKLAPSSGGCGCGPSGCC